MFSYLFCAYEKKVNYFILFLVVLLGIIVDVEENYECALFLMWIGRCACFHILQIVYSLLFIFYFFYDFLTYEALNFMDFLLYIRKWVVNLGLYLIWSHIHHVDVRMLECDIRVKKWIFLVEKIRFLIPNSIFEAFGGEKGYLLACLLLF